MLKFLKIFTYLLVIIGAINWGFIGILNFDIVAFLFGNMTVLTRIVYTLVGISALVSLGLCCICYNNEDSNN